MNDDNFHQKICCNGECRQGKDCPMCHATTFAAYAVAVICLMLSVISFIYWANS